MPKPRKENSRAVRQRILIICEGRETEPIYFNGIKTDKRKNNPLTALQIEVYDTKINTGKELVQLAKELKEAAKQERNEYDSIWVVIDKDGYTKHPQAFDQARANKIEIAFSSISFEYWFLLHFTKTSKPFTKSANLIKYMKQGEYYKGYEKSLDHYQKLKHFTNIAIQNAEWLRKQIEYKDYMVDKRYEFNPFTDVDRLVSYLLSL
jgi:hypothetical protein